MRGSNSPGSAARTPWCCAKHPLARIGTARKSLAPTATRFGSASRSPLLNVSTERFRRDLADRFLTATAVLHPRCKLVATRDNGKPALGVYARDSGPPILHATGLLVLTLAGDRICAMTRFETSMLAHFGCHGPSRIEVLAKPRPTPRPGAAGRP